MKKSPTKTSLLNNENHQPAANLKSQETVIDQSDYGQFVLLQALRYGPQRITITYAARPMLQPIPEVKEEAADLDWLKQSTSTSTITRSL